jgi:hypothetical protein
MLAWPRVQLQDRLQGDRGEVHVGVNDARCTQESLRLPPVLSLPLAPLTTNLSKLRQARAKTYAYERSDCRVHFEASCRDARTLRPQVNTGSTQRPEAAANDESSGAADSAPQRV